MNLLVGFYEDADSSRTSEFIECLRRNAVNCHISRSAVVIEDESPLALLRQRYPIFAHRKIRAILDRRRVTFSHLFTYANEVLSGCLVIIANADIWFGESLGLLEDVPLAGRFL